MNWSAVAAIAQVGILLTAVGSLIFAWRSGLLTRLVEAERRKPIVGIQLVALTPADGDTTAVADNLRDGYTYWFMEAFKRDPEDWSKYPKQRQYLLVDNGGTGTAVRVTIPYKMTVYDVDQSTPPVLRVDPKATHEGRFEVLHINPGTQKYAPLFIDATYFPAYKIEWEEPEVIGLDGKPARDAWTDLGPERRVVEGNNGQTWDTLRLSVWEASRPSALKVDVGTPRKDVNGIVLPVTATAQNSLGIATTATVTLSIRNSSGAVALGPYYATSGVRLDLQLPLILAGEYVVTAAVGAVRVTESFSVPA